jgi:hypothetical protein
MQGGTNTFAHMQEYITLGVRCHMVEHKRKWIQTFLLDTKIYDFLN